MRQRFLILSALAALAALPLPARAQEQRRIPLIGPEIGVYFPVAGKAKDAFGSSFINYGFGIGRVVAPGTRPAFDFRVIANRDLFRGGDRRAVFIPVGVSFARPLSPITQTAGELTGAIPYAGVTANIIPNNIRSDKDGINSGWRTAFGGSVFAGVAFQERYHVDIRFFGMSSVRGMNLSGWNLTAGARF
jgi:hypothetical protein